MKYMTKYFAILPFALLMIVLNTGCDSTEKKMKHWGEQHNFAKLEKVLSNEQIEVRLYAISLMAQTSHADALKPLIGCLQDEDPRIRNYAAYELGYLGSCGVVDKPTVIQLVDILKDPNYVSRHDIITALGYSGIPDAIPPLVAMLHDKDDSIQESVIAALKCLIKESKFPCSKIRATEVLNVSNALEAVRSNGGVKAKAER
ncbi:MAG: HEAT repeat domain-containing protein [Candidatus Cloacimonetes bacterium]|nr:HEAT repeat domain-containing protein [Candidatus Cloacimonadota bacterium]